MEEISCRWMEASDWPAVTEMCKLKRWHLRVLLPGKRWLAFRGDTLLGVAAYRPLPADSYGWHLAQLSQIHRLSGGRIDPTRPWRRLLHGGALLENAYVAHTEVTTLKGETVKFIGENERQ